MRKRILASLMALILALSLLPTAALATGETQEPEQEAQMSVSENGTEGGGEDATIPVETGDETDTSDGTETPVVTTPTATPTETTPVETLTPVVQTIEESDVAAIGDEGYETLAAAVSAAQSGDTIVMQKDTTLTGYIEITKDITLDLNGKTITSDNTKRLAFLVGTPGVTFTIDDTAGDGKIVSERADNSNVIEVSDGELVVKGGELVNTWFVVFVRRNGVATIEGGTLRSTVASALSTNGSRVGEENYSGDAVMNVKGGNLISEQDVAIYVPAGTLNISGGTITGATAVYSKCGTTTITGGKIQGTGANADFQHSNEGCVATGDALVIEACAYPNGNPTVRISGGRFTSTHASAVGYYEYGENEAEEISITGGTFSTKPSEAYIASGYEAKENTPSKGLWTVAAKDGMEANVTAPGAGATNSSATVTGSFSGYEQAGGEAGEGSVEADGGSVTINVQTGKDAEDESKPAPNGQVSSTTVTVDKASVSSVASADVDVTLETDVADLEIPSEAWSSMANAAKNDNITIAVKENKDTTTWEVTAQDESDNNVFAAGSQGEIKITVAYTAGTNATDVKVYCIETGEWMETIWDKTNALLSWFAPHFSSYGTVETKAGDVATWTVKGGTTGTGSLAQALEAVKDDGGEINLLQDAPLPDAEYFLDGPVTINGNDHEIDVTVAAGDSATDNGNIAFNVDSGATFTLNSVNMTISGTANRDTANGYDGTGFNVSHGAYLKVNNSTITVQNIERATTAGGAEQAHFEFTNSTVEFRNIDGNASNGGDWTLDDTDLTINGCGSYGLSASNVTVKNGSTVNVSNVELSAIIITNKAGVTGELKVEGNSTITVSSSGSRLPHPSKWGSAVGVIDLGHGSGGTDYENDGSNIPNADARLSVLDNSSIILNSNNDPDANFIYLTNTAEMENAPTATLPTIQVEPGMATDTYTVRFMVDGKVYNLKRLKVNNGSDTFGFPLDPVKAGWTFTGWTYPTNGTVTANSTSSGAYYISNAAKGTTYDFVAQWSYNVPVVPDDNTPSYSGGSSSSETSYSNTIDASDGGSVKVSPRTPSRGETVTITPTPDTGYEVDEVIVTDRNGDEVEVTANRNGTYTFEQPRGRVTIEVTFVRTGGTVGTAPFLDVAEDAWYADAVAYVYDNGLMSGTSTTLFSPNATTTRGMIVTMLYRLEGEPRISSGSVFDDVDAGMYYADAVAWASQNDIVTGYDEATFGPNNAITREQMAAILYRYAQYKGYRTTADADLSGYVDADSVSSYALASLQWAHAAGLVTGTSSNTLTPDGSATRAQVATIFMRFMEDVAE